jgi:hypothetical protein
MIGDAADAKETRALRSRNMTTDVPLGWSSVKQGRGHFLWGCRNTINTFANFDPDILYARLAVREGKCLDERDLNLVVLHCACKWVFNRNCLLVDVIRVVQLDAYFMGMGIQQWGRRLDGKC